MSVLSLKDLETMETHFTGKAETKAGRLSRAETAPPALLLPHLITSVLSVQEARLTR